MFAWMYVCMHACMHACTYVRVLFEPVALNFLALFKRNASGQRPPPPLEQDRASLRLVCFKPEGCEDMFLEANRERFQRVP